ncbi:hypothetical protein FRB94_013621 [Tulasnella sp. JGI-2019a]|nr:hypothetical protein FRB93_007639 [Tulasnella sp. JGI-2019a]KAG9008261.1 hypothetical protein FRB94_013621 [Tulasnella sp. JGI-2019a]
MIQTPSTPTTPLKPNKKRKAEIYTPEGHSSKKSKKEKRKHLNVGLSTLDKPSTPTMNSRPGGKAKSKERLLHENEESTGEFAVVSASVMLSIPPVFAGNPRVGVEEMLDSMVMRHIPSLQGIVLSHSNHRFLASSAPILNECPYALCRVAFDATVWSPKIGMALVGKVNLFSPDHISLLIHRTFNVSIPRSHIPSDEYVFEHGNNANHDHQYYPGATSYLSSAKAGEMDIDHPNELGIKREAGDDWVVEENTQGMIGSVGQWIHKDTGEKVGGANGNVQFTIVGMTLANQMISLIGSLHHDPFDPRHSDVASRLSNHHRVQDAVTAMPDSLVDNSDDDSLPDLDMLAVGSPTEPKRKKKKGLGDGDDEKRRRKEARKEARKETKQDDREGVDPRPKKKKKTKKPDL